MSVSVVGTFRVNPFPRATPADPLGQMIGVGTATGDATGNTLQVVWSLPLENVYLVQAMSAQTLTSTALVHHYSLSTGVLLDAIAEQYKFMIAPEVEFATRASFWIPPRMINLPNSFGTVQLFCRTTNINLAVHQVVFRALVFERNSFLVVPARDMAIFQGG